jgi:hypothetical protein
MPEGKNKKAYSLDVLMNSYRLINLVSSGPCCLSIQIDGSPDAVLPIEEPIDGGDTTFFKSILPVIEAAVQLRLRANATDVPVHVEEIVRQRAEILEASRALFEDGFSFSFETELPQSDVIFTPLESLFISGLAIDCSYYAYALRARVEPKIKADRVTWSASNVTPLVIEQLNGDIRQDYERFKDKVIAISGVKTIVARSLTISL